jgi:hypothetical protein
MPEREQADGGGDAAAEQGEQHGGLADGQAPAFGIPFGVVSDAVADADVHDAHVQRDVAGGRVSGQERAGSADLDPPPRGLEVAV